MDIDGRMAGLVRDFLEKSSSPGPEERKRRISFYFMSKLDAQHEKILALKRLAEKIRKAGAQPLFYVTPVNVEMGEKYGGPSFSNRVRLNVDVIKRELAGTGAPFLDWSFAFPSNQYFNNPGEERVIDEHVNALGRKEIAQRLADVLKNTF